MSDLLTQHAKAERRLSEHLSGRKQCESEKAGRECIIRETRNLAYEAYTKTPHPSSLGRGGSQ